MPEEETPRLVGKVRIYKETGNGHRIRSNPLEAAAHAGQQVRQGAEPGRQAPTPQH